jgi:hypothetical protein
MLFAEYKLRLVEAAQNTSESPFPIRHPPFKKTVMKSHVYTLIYETAWSGPDMLKSVPNIIHSMLITCLTQTSESHSTNDLCVVNDVCNSHFLPASVAAAPASARALIHSYVTILLSSKTSLLLADLVKELLVMYE